MSIEAYPSPNGVLTSLIWRKTAAGGETSLSGYDNASQALSYTPGQEQVYLNGILLVRGSDYTATNGTSITGLTALAEDDFVQINCYNNFSVASVPTTSLTGTVANNQLANSSITINGSAVSLGGSVSLPGDIESVTASSPLTGGGSSGALTIGIQSASTSQAGSVQLSDSTSTTSSVLAATPTAVKSAYDLADGAIPKTLTTTTGDIIYASGANTPARLGIGSTGNVLTVASGVPSWSAPAGGGMTLLSTTSIVGGGTTTISSINQSYNHLYVVIEGAEGGGDGAGFRINSSVGCQTLMMNQATSSNRSSGYGSGLSMVFYNYPSYDSASTELKNFGYMYFYNYSNSVQMKYAEHGSCYHQNASVLTMTKGGSFWNVTDAITQLVYDGNSSRPETGGVIKVYGIK